MSRLPSIASATMKSELMDIEDARMPVQTFRLANKL
jgi:hypothetical protein